MTMDDRLVHMPGHWRAPVVFSSPHSGRDYTAAFLAQTVLDAHAIRSSEDAFVDRLFAHAPHLGAPLIAAQMPRAYVDLNRAPEEMDPAVIDDVIARSHNPRVSSGLGVIPRVVGGARAIYRGKISRAEAEDRIARHWHPYHAGLRHLLTQAQRRFGQVVLIDCHSMPHDAIAAHMRGAEPRPQVVLGDRFGATAGAEVMATVEAAFQSAGLRVARNTPFAGAYITQFYGRPSRGQHAVQVEIDRALYMDEARIEPRPDFSQFVALMDGVIAQIIAALAPDRALAAE